MRTLTCLSSTLLLFSSALFILSLSTSHLISLASNDNLSLDVGPWKACYNYQSAGSDFGSSGCNLIDSSCSLPLPSPEYGHRQIITNCRYFNVARSLLLIGGAMAVIGWVLTMVLFCAPLIEAKSSVFTGAAIASFLSFICGMIAMVLFIHLFHREPPSSLSRKNDSGGEWDYSFSSLSAAWPTSLIASIILCPIALYFTDEYEIQSQREYELPGRSYYGSRKDHDTPAQSAY